jgi:bacillithiol synthase
MGWNSTHLNFKETGYFSRIITDYLNKANTLRPFYEHEVSLDGIKAAIRNREAFPTDRAVLVKTLIGQYGKIELKPAVQHSIDKLEQKNTFTITTAHQPAIFTGNLYFVYKIIHVIRLAAFLSDELPDYQFVPVFFMGSEDADLEELGKIYLDEDKLVWETNQTGAVGRMKTEGLDRIVERISGEFSLEPFGEELIALLKTTYLQSLDIQTATLKLIDHLFSEYGLIVLIADDTDLKKEMIPVFADDLFHQKPSAIVAETISELSEHYKVQAKPREINLFYLKDNIRGRIEKVKQKYIIHDSGLSFDEEGLKEELVAFPDRFSPNVILRGLFQETILPNIIFVGGGGETAYWLELKNLFAYYHIPFPVLVLRNSFLIIKKKYKEKLDKTGLIPSDIFRDEEILIEEIVHRESRNRLNLLKEIEEASLFYKNLEETSRQVDPSIANHVIALQAKALKPIRELEKKLLKAEKRKFEERRRQIHYLKSSLFPLNGLQERIENFMPYYASMGPKFLELLFENSGTLEQKFIILSEE